MDISATTILTTTSATSSAPPPPPKASKTLELASRTIRAPPHAYIHLQLLTSSATSSSSSVAHVVAEDDDAGQDEQLDALQVKSYCSAALKQFLGLHGSAIPFDILKVEGSHGWIRVPRDDLAAFAAAITAWSGTSSGGQHVTLRLKGCSDWLGTLVGRDGEDRVWSG
ncbi:uncharacterized protein B0I36DRAFT_361736 [Microdochium trichocladiopsis]|uniref:Ribonucleases P/MRP subunit Pop8-like domain-containing protein n=1 Tax=Microdochium trichocladiopsis TaxID=1682393 RepID=A0A9P8Y8D6_9PEZI|nr:uncharacterized protein B0I36DRAFT_361736 [Microdochium trichocladiopsis]KAH7033002.1 hypothetical protein B0I36DRAFT_361736 [Microdochium trichocladiopsis]